MKSTKTQETKILSFTTQKTEPQSFDPGVLTQSFDPGVLKQTCSILGDTINKLYGEAISTYLKKCGVKDIGSEMTKRIRLFDALGFRQSMDGFVATLGGFMERVNKPELHLEALEQIRPMQAELNRVFSFEGLRLTAEGELRQCAPASATVDVKSAAAELWRTLVDGGIHPDVLESCRPELVQENYFHAVLEATKSLAQKIRKKSGLKSDGPKLVDKAFGIGAKAHPILAFNELSTETEHSEHTGLMYLMKGLFCTFRNPTAHAPRSSWEITAQDAFEVLTVASLLHRRVDVAIKMKRS